MDSHLVVVPYDSLNLVDNKIVLRGGTKDTLKMLHHLPGLRRRRKAPNTLTGRAGQSALAVCGVRPIG